MPNAKGLAAVVPLNYVRRTEHSLFYFSTDWPELYDVLNDPCKFFEQAFLNDFPGSDEPIWSVVSPVTIILQPLNDNPRSAAGAVDFLLGGKGPEFHVSEAIEVLKGELLEREIGCFIVEFAIKTKVVNIRYWVPPGNADRQTQRYGWDLQAQTHGTLITKKVGSLHFDLVSASMRPGFVIDFIENRKRMIAKLGVGTPFFTGNGTLKGPGNSIRHGQVAPDDPKNKFKPYDKSSPTVVIEDATQSDPAGCVCAVVTTSKDGNTYSIEDAEMKWYAVCPEAAPSEGDGGTS